MVVSWAGMRGIVTLAAAFAIPEILPDGLPFPYRDLILICAFTVVLGTLVLQGLTIKPLIRRLGLTDDDPVTREVRFGRERAYQAVLDSLKDNDSLPAKQLRKEYTALLDLNTGTTLEASVEDVPGGSLRRRAIVLARQEAAELRRTDFIDDAYRILIRELDWAELNAGGDREI